MTEIEMKKWQETAYNAGRDAFGDPEHYDWEEACFAWNEDHEKNMPNTNRYPLYAAFEQGWKERSAEEGLTQEERDWCMAFAQKLGLRPDDVTFEGDVWRGEVQQVSIVLGWEQRYYTTQGWDEENQCLGEKIRKMMPPSEAAVLELRKFQGSDRPDGWCAFYNSPPGYCVVQGKAEPKPGKECLTPEAAVIEVSKRLRKRAKKMLKKAKFMEGGL